jgi:hypothetical protein
MLITVELPYGTWRKRGRKRDDRASVILHNIGCEGRGCKDVCIESC